MKLRRNSQSGTGKAWRPANSRTAGKKDVSVRKSVPSMSNMIRFITGLLSCLARLLLQELQHMNCRAVGPVVQDSAAGCGPGTGDDQSGKQALLRVGLGNGRYSQVL